jgi:enoyl-CoA hydratase
MCRDGNVAIITIDNPPVNALRHGVRKGILDCVTAARDDTGVEAIVLTGAGRTFVAGADITEFGKPPQPPGLMEVITVIDDIKKPTIAAVHGTPLGGGLELALACTFRLALPSAKLGFPEIKLGLIPGYGGTQRLPRLVGESRATEMILTGRTLDAEEAARIGLVNRLVDGDLIETGIAFAREMTGYSLPVLGLARDAIRRALDLPLPEGLKIEADLSTLAFQTEDSVEGMTAFIEKRKPVFKDG